MRAPLDHPIMAGFKAQLERINAIADASPGFVWRLATPEGDATALRVFEDDQVLVNMSVWESLEALHEFVYRGPHVGPLRQRKDWFLPWEGPVLALWWVPAGHLPSIEEAKVKLEELRLRGPTPSAFTFRMAFPPPGEAPSKTPEVDAEFCGGIG
jgi:hypothetical protein